jgi:SAM-dependent methyltransferase
MSEPGVTAKSRKFYELFPFPGNRPLDRDGLIFLRHFAVSLHRHTSLTGRTRLRVLDAGCGTGNTSLSLARRFPEVDFIGVDQSRTSLARARQSAGNLGLTNLRYRFWNLMKPLPRGTLYDIVMCLGVLHHTADMKRVLRNLHRSLRNNGELFLWIYGKHGRYRHTLNMRLLAMLRETDPESSSSLELAKDFIRNAGSGMALDDLLGTQPPSSMPETLFEDPIWIADQFLNPHEKLLDLEQLLALTRSSGFAVDQIIGFDDATARNMLSALLYERFQKLTRLRRLIALDLLLKPERYFLVLTRRNS